MIFKIFYKRELLAIYTTSSQLNLEKKKYKLRIIYVQVCVERAIEKTKNYRILQTTSRLSMTAVLNKLGNILLLGKFFTPFDCRRLVFRDLSVNRTFHMSKEQIAPVTVN